MSVKSVKSKELESMFLKWYSSDDYPHENTCLEWREYDPQTKQVFFYVVGEWNRDIKKGRKEWFRQYNGKITISRIINTYGTTEDWAEKES